MPHPPRSPLPLLPVQFPGAPRAPEPLPPSPPVPGRQWAALAGFCAFWLAGFGSWVALAPETLGMLKIGMLWSLTLTGVMGGVASAWIVATALWEVVNGSRRGSPQEHR